MPMGFRLCIASRSTRALTLVLPVKAILPTFTVGPSFTLNVSETAAGGSGFHFRANRGELMSVLAQHLLQHHLGALDDRGVVLALHREGNLFLLEAVQHVGDGNRVQALVVDLADRRLFTHVHNQLHAVLLLFVDALNAHIVEVAGIPQRVEVALHHRGIVLIAGPRKQPRQNGFLGDATVADHLRLAQHSRRIRGRELRAGLHLGVPWGKPKGRYRCCDHAEFCAGEGGARTANAARARTHSLGRSVQGACAHSRSGKDNHTLTALWISTLWNTKGNLDYRRSYCPLYGVVRVTRSALFRNCARAAASFGSSTATAVVVSVVSTFNRTGTGRLWLACKGRSRWGLA